MTKAEFEKQIKLLAMKHLRGRITVQQAFSQQRLLLADYFEDTSCTPPKPLAPSFCPDCHGVVLFDGVVTERYPGVLLTTCTNGHTGSVGMTVAETDALSAYNHAQYADVRNADDA